MDLSRVDGILRHIFVLCSVMYLHVFSGDPYFLYYAIYQVACKCTVNYLLKVRFVVVSI